MLTIPFVKLDQKTRVQTAISNMVLAGELKELKNNCLGGGLSSIAWRLIPLELSPKHCNGFTKAWVTDDLCTVDAPRWQRGLGVLRSKKKRDLQKNR